MIADFEDREEGGFFFTANDHESLLARAKDPFDNALPSGNSIAVLDLLELHRRDRQPGVSGARGQGARGVRHARCAQVPAALPLHRWSAWTVPGREPAPAGAEALASAGARRSARKDVVGGSARLADGGQRASPPE